MTASHIQYQVVLIEPSEIIAKGIMECCKQYSCFRFKSYFTGWKTFINQHIRQEECQILIINPAIIQFLQLFNVKDLFVDYPNTCIIALQTQYISESILNGFDGIINIYDEGALVPRKLLHIIDKKKNVEVVKGTSPLLTNREIEVLLHLVKGLSNKEIASTMCISTQTVMTHRKILIRKTGIKTIAGLVLYALSKNLVSIETLTINLPHHSTHQQRI